MELSEQAVDVTQLDLAGQVHSRVLAGHYRELLEAVQDAARELGYFFAKAETAAAMPELLSEVLAEAVVLRKETSVSPWDRDAAEERARRFIACGFGAVLRDDMLGALEAAGIRLQETAQAPLLLTSAKIMRDESLLTTRALDTEERGESAVAFRVAGDVRVARRAEGTPLRVDVTKDEIVISGEGSLATYNWKPDRWGRAVKRLSIRAGHKARGDIEEKVFSVVATDGEDSGHQGVLVDGLTESEARDLIVRIQDAVKVSLGITEPAIPVVDMPEAPVRLDAGSQSSQPAGIGRMVLKGIGKVLSTAGLVVTIVAVLCALSFGLPVAYKAGEHVAAGMFPVADAGDVRKVDPYGGELLRDVPLARPVPHLKPVPLGRE
ncbi:hypothetical protein SAMN03159335_06339 [Burkholderia cepacia]|uniref:hypothetical protein n=1 Tax=Burkholderia cepacia TaxID=292 RepID=UPI0008C07AFE|nr:hypothetical protein [Burkholderia cepacia]SEU40548.1 hypothetical protein SAMN03159335_06339 [Burkholderia cepacia]